MAGRDSDRPPGGFEHEFDEWGIDDDRYQDVSFVGFRGASPVFWAPSSRSLFEARADETEKRITPKEDTERTFDAEESIGEAIERFGEEVGWDGLSEWAREHLEDDSEESG